MAARNARVTKDDASTESEPTPNPESWEQEQTLSEQTLFINPEEPETSFDRDARIAELAYYRAEQRGFEPGHELEDWYAAEQEINISQH